MSWSIKAKRIFRTGSLKMIYVSECDEVRGEETECCAVDFYVSGTA